MKLWHRLSYLIAALCSPLIIYAGSASAEDPKMDAEPMALSLADLRKKYEIDASRYAQIDGTQLHFADEGEGVPVVLLHASFLNFRAWDGVAARLKESYRVIRPDFVNAGLSGLDAKMSPDAPMDYTERRTEMLAKLLDHLDLKRFHLIATSSGASSGFRYASYFPGRVERLILINSAGMPRTMQTDPNRDRAEERKWAKMKVKPPAFWRNLLDRNFTDPNEPPEWLVDLAFNLNRRDENPGPGTYYFKTGNPKSILAGVTAPTLIQWGMENPTVMHLEADVIEHWMTGAPTLIKKYEGLGHYPYIEDFDQVYADIQAFLAGDMDKDLRQTQRLPVE